MGRWVSVCLMGVFAVAACESREPPEPQDQTVRPARIYTVADTTQTVERVFVGRVQALNSIDISFEVAGPLVELPVLEGQNVQQGDLLAALDTTDFELAVKEAEVQVKIARQDLDRKRRVYAQKGIARSAVDDAQSVYELQVVRLGQAQERLADARLTAPFAGYVAQRYVDRYGNVQAGSRIIRLNDLSKLLIVANVGEALLATSNADQVVSMHAQFDFLPGAKFPLQIHENQGDADSVAQTYQVSFSMDNPSEWNILPGMTATVRVTLRDTGSTHRTLLPATALVTNPDNTFAVWVFDPDTQLVSKRAVRVGSPEQAGIPVISGLQGGEQVVAAGADQLMPGMKVRPFGKTP